MERTEARYLPLAVLNEHRRRAVKLRERGMGFALWNRQAVAQLIHHRLGEDIFEQ